MKIFLTIILAVILSLSGSILVLGNSFSLEAENGKLLQPAGIGFDFSTSFTQGESFSFDSLPVIAKLSYGIRPSVTISGEVNRLDENNRQMLVKAYYSPSTSAMGYTAYLGYDLGGSEIPMYGLSLWLNSNLLYTFVNVEADKKIGGTSLSVTPGLNLRLGSRIRLSGEMGYQLKTGDQELRVGASYTLVNNLSGKLGFRTGRDGSGQMYTIGLVSEI